MEALFTKLIEISLIASWLILIILVLRIFFKKASKSFYCFLWALVGLRLIFPFSIESIFSLIPRKEILTPTIQTGISVLNQTIEQNTQTETVIVPQSVNWMSILTIIWMIGIITLSIYSIISYYRLYKKVSISLPYKKNIYYCDSIDSPFILGIIQPKIYLPSTINESQIEYVLKHEYAHLKRKDHLWKPLGFVLLTIYWFNPMIWIAYITLCKDIESACDEYVIKKMDSYNKKMYSETLFTCSVDRKLIMACPLAFGEVGVKERIKSIVNYKKPTFWVLCVSLVACIVLSVGFLTEPKSSVSDFTFTTGLLNKEIKLNKEQKEYVLELLDNYSFDYKINENAYDDGTIYRLHYKEDKKTYDWKISKTKTYLEIKDGNTITSFTGSNPQLLNDFAQYDSLAKESIDMNPLKLNMNADEYPSMISNGISLHLDLNTKNTELLVIDSYIVLAYEQLFDETNEIIEMKYYILALSQGFDVSNDEPEEIEYSYSPAIVTITNMNDILSLKDFWKPNNITLDEISNHFPSGVVNDVMNYEDYLEELRNEGLQKAKIHILQEQLASDTSALLSDIYTLIKPYDNGYTDEDYKNAEGEECLHERGRFIIDYNKYIFVQIDSDPHRLGTYIVTFHNYNNGEVKNIYVNERDYFEIQDILKDKGFKRIDLK